LSGWLSSKLAPRSAPAPAPAPEPAPPADPQAELEAAFRDQRRLLEELRQSIDEVAAARQRLEMRVQLHEHRLAEYDEQARAHLLAGREDLARVMLERKRLAAGQLDELQSEIATLAAEQAQLMSAETRLEAKLETLRTRIDVLRTKHTSAKAQARLSEAAAGMASDVSSLNTSLEQVETHAAELRARSQALDQMIADGLVEGDDDPHARFEHELQLTTVDDDLARLRRELAAENPQ
jgi:phage shock protein A